LEVSQSGVGGGEVWGTKAGQKTTEEDSAVIWLAFGLLQERFPEMARTNYLE
jgi:hypothetical protein